MTVLTPILARYAFAAAVALGAMAWWSSSMVNRGVQRERVRVEKIGKKTDAKAQKARRAAEAKPHDALAKYCRDCGSK